MLTLSHFDRCLKHFIFVSVTRFVKWMLSFVGYDGFTIQIWTGPWVPGGDVRLPRVLFLPLFPTPTSSSRVRRVPLARQQRQSLRSRSCLSRRSRRWRFEGPSLRLSRSKICEQNRCGVLRQLLKVHQRWRSSDLCCLSRSNSFWRRPA